VFTTVAAITDERPRHIANILPEVRQNKVNQCQYTPSPGLVRQSTAFAFYQDFSDALEGERFSLLKHPSDPRSEGAMKINTRGNQMSQNLNLLRQNYCRPATLNGRKNHYLFPLEKECEQGKTLLAKAPKSLLHLQELDPYGLQQTYRDGATGAQLPVFAVFDLEGDHQYTFEITTDSVPTTAQASTLPSYIPFQKTQAFVRKINERRMRAERAVAPLAVILGIFSASICLFSAITVKAGAAVPYALVGGWILGAFLTYVLGLFVLNRVCPWKKMVITAEFDGILPKEVREKARKAKDQFDNLYLIVDQQHRWKSALLPDPRPRALDPLLIGEVKQGRRRKFFVIHQFDLTEAEQYLADEFATCAPIP
jgi:hypothetical protein